MTMALDASTNHLIPPTKGVVATCPNCSQPVLARCGLIRKDHWCHLTRSRCGKWHEPETAWHRNWKDLLPVLWREVVIGEHRADIQRPDGTVIELQHSPLAGDIIEKREAHYGSMIWVLDFAQHVDRFFITEQFSEYEFQFRWKYARKSWMAANSRIFLDLGSVQIQDLFGEEKEFLSFKHFKVWYEIMVRANWIKLPNGRGGINSTILELDCLNKYGWGKVRAIDRDEFMNWIQTDQLPISTLAPILPAPQPLPQQPADNDHEPIVVEETKLSSGLWDHRLIGSRRA